jgi:hypothetical protein
MHMLLAAAIFSLYHWVAIVKNHGSYTPFSVSRYVSSITFDETHAYAPAAQRFMSLGRIPAEVDNYERRDSSAGIPFLPEAILGGMGVALAGLDRAFIAANCIFPPLLLLLLLALSREVVQNLHLRFLAAWSTLIIPFGPRNVFGLGYDALRAPPDVTRSPQPEISLLFVLLAVFLLARALSAGSDWRSVLASGVASGLVVYSYYFYAVAWSLTLGLLFTLAMVGRKWAVAKRLAATIAVMIVCTLPFALVVTHASVAGGQTHLLQRMGVFTRSPDLPALLVATGGSALLLFYGKRLVESRPAKLGLVILSVLVLGGLWGLNWQVLSGYDAQHTHFWNRLIQPIGYSVSVCLVFRRLEEKADRRPSVLRLASVSALALLLLGTAARQAYAAIQVAPYLVAQNPDIRLLQWARTNLPPEQVVGTTDPGLILMIPAFAPQFTYVPSGLRSLTPSGEILERYFELAASLGLSTEEVRQIAARRAHLRPSLLLLALRTGGDSESFCQTYERALHRRVHCTHRLDYVILGAGQPELSHSQFPTARLIYSNQAYRLFDVRRISGSLTSAATTQLTYEHSRP